MKLILIVRKPQLDNDGFFNPEKMKKKNTQTYRKRFVGNCLGVLSFVLFHGFILYFFLLCMRRSHLPNDTEVKK
jgi:hypothetical protein